MSTGWIFRGQTNSEWGLSSSLERILGQIINDNTIKIIDRQNIVNAREKIILQEFKRRVHHYISSPPHNDNSLEWLALIQHYGGATRLLDFSHSFYIGAFFAVEDNKPEYENSAIWAISLTNINKIIEQKIDDKYKNWITHNTNKEHIQLSQVLFDNGTSNNFVFGVEPERMNERLAIQQGLFLFPANVGASFEENLAGIFGAKADVFHNTPAATYQAEAQTEMMKAFLPHIVVLKIIVPQYLREEILKDLWSMNVSSATLFPGIDGFTRSLNYHLIDANKI